MDWEEQKWICSTETASEFTHNKAINSSSRAPANLLSSLLSLKLIRFITNAA